MVGILSQSDYRWGPSANQITGARTGSAHAGVARAGMLGTLSPSDYTGVAHAGVVRAGAACVGVAHAGVVCTGAAHKGCARRGCHS